MLGWSPPNSLRRRGQRFAIAALGFVDGPRLFKVAKQRTQIVQIVRQLRPFTSHEFKMHNQGPPGQLLATRNIALEK